MQRTGPAQRNSADFPAIPADIEPWTTQRSRSSEQPARGSNAGAAWRPFGVAQSSGAASPRNRLSMTVVMTRDSYSEPRLSPASRTLAVPWAAAHIAIATRSGSSVRSVPSLIAVSIAAAPSAKALDAAGSSSAGGCSAQSGRKRNITWNSAGSSRACSRAGRVDEKWDEALDPAVHGDVVDLDATLTEQPLDVAIGEPVPQIPPHSETMISGGNRNPTKAERWIAGTEYKRRGIIPPPSPPAATIRQYNTAVFLRVREYRSRRWWLCPSPRGLGPPTCEAAMAVPEQQSDDGPVQAVVAGNAVQRSTQHKADAVPYDRRRGVHFGDGAFVNPDA